MTLFFDGGFLRVFSAHKMKVIYPTLNNVRESLEGYEAGGSLPYTMESDAKQPWLRALFHKWKSDDLKRLATFIREQKMRYNFKSLEHEQCLILSRTRR